MSLKDEMQVSLGLEYDDIIGQPAMRPSNASTNDQLANHALVFTLAGLTSGWK